MIKKDWDYDSNTFTTVEDTEEYEAPMSIPLQTIDKYYVYENLELIAEELFNKIRGRFIHSHSVTKKAK